MSTGRPVLDYVRAQQAILVGNDAQLRAGSVDVGLAPTHAAVRRLRSTIRNFALPLTAVQSQELDLQLGSYGARLSPLLQLELAAGELLSTLPVLGDGLAISPVRQRIELTLQADAVTSRQQLVSYLGESPYAQLLLGLDGLIASLLTGSAHRSRDLVLGAAKAQGRLVRRLNELQSQSGSDEVEPALQSARKAARQALHAAELAAPAVGVKAANKKIRRLTSIHDGLSAHQMIVRAARFVLQLQQRPDSAPIRFELGMLYERELACARDQLSQLADWATAVR